MKIKEICLALALLSLSVRPVFSQNLPRDFVLRNAASGKKFNLPVGIAFAPGNRIYVTEKRGKVYVIHNNNKISTPFINLEGEVLSNESNGLLGIAVDPDFENNRWVYLLYVVDPTGGLDDDKTSFSRLTRYRAKSSNLNQADLSTRQVLIGKTWGDGFPACGNQHVIGTIRFGSDGSLLVGSGDATRPGSADAGGEYPECFGPGKFDPKEDIGAFRAQYLGSLAGKILRIDKDTGLGLPSNPYYTGDPFDNQSKVWAYGLRNPFRFSVRPNGSANPAGGDPGSVYIGDVGWGQYEEVSVTKVGGGQNFGWPCFEGPRSVSQFQRKNPPRGGCRTFGSPENPADHTLPLIHWHHTDPAKSKPTGILGNSVTGGAFYTGNQYPQNWRGYFYADYQKAWIRVLEVNANDKFVGIKTFAEWSGGNAERGIVDLQSHPVTGDMYFVDITQGQVMQIAYTGQAANQAPIAVASMDTTWGHTPLTVHFKGSDSHDPDGDPLTFKWDFGNGDTSTQANPIYTYTTGGNFNIKLTVKDNKGAQSDFFLQIIVGSVPPVPSIISPVNGVSLFATEEIHLEGTAVDADEPESNLQFHWVVDLHHNDHVHPAALDLFGKTGHFIPGEHGDPWDLIYLVVKLQVTDSSGLVGESKSYVVMKVVGETDITTEGTPIALITSPTGTGNPNIEVIRDGVYPAVGSSDPQQQYSTSTGSGGRTEDWIGYEFPHLERFGKLIFQEGMHFADGGWFESLQVQIRNAGVWKEVFFLNDVPPYQNNNGINYNQHTLLFSPESGDAIRIFGTPGGSNSYISVAELRVIKTPFESPQPVNRTFNPIHDAFVWSKKPSNNYGASINLRVRKSSSALQIAYFKFQVTGISANVTSSKLRLFVSDAGSDGGEVYLVSNDYKTTNTAWEESGLLWPNAPDLAGVPLQSAGAANLQQWVEFDVTSAVAGNGTYSFAVKTTSSDMVSYTSRETSTAPQLIITLDAQPPAPLPPQIISFGPSSGPVGSEVDIVGEHFTGTTEVSFNHVPAQTIHVHSDTQIHAEVPAGATTGRIRITTPAGTAVSATDFVVETAPGLLPVITSFTPTSGVVGTAVTITGSNFTGVHDVQFNGVSASDYHVHSDTEIIASVPSAATTGKIQISNAAGAGISVDDFTVLPGGVSTLTFNPIHDAYVRSSRPTTNRGSSRDLRVRKTASADLLAYFKFDLTGLNAPVLSAKLRLTVLDSGSDGGSIHTVSNNYDQSSTPWVESGIIWNNAPKVTTPALSNLGAVVVGNVVEFDVIAAILSNSIFSLAIKNNSSDVVKYYSKESAHAPELVIVTGTPSPSAPQITSFTPTTGEVGTQVTITGMNFTGATSVLFGGVNAPGFIVDSNTSIRVAVPSAAQTGKISVTTPDGTAVSAQDFTVTTAQPPAPIVSGFAPTSGAVATEVTITGSHFTDATKVKFNTVAATTFSVASDTQILATVPDGATTGKISVTTPAGTGVSASDFVVTTGGAAGTLTVNPTDDAFAWSKNQTNNYGNSIDLRVRKTKSALQIAYFKFNVTGVSGSVTRATLRLFVTDGSDDGGSVYLVSNNYKNGAAWKEAGLDWTNAPEINTAAINTAGAVSAGSVVEYDVTAAVAGIGEYSFAVRNFSGDV
ncbi:MAG: DNRLRE domain-containing protein, partial [bacterium]